jgi:hypothetical protein
LRKLLKIFSLFFPGPALATTDIEGLSRFYLGVFQGMAVQARDGAGPAELRPAVAAAMSAWPINGRIAAR